MENQSSVKGQDNNTIHQPLESQSKSEAEAMEQLADFQRRADAIQAATPKAVRLPKVVRTIADRLAAISTPTPEEVAEQERRDAIRRAQILGYENDETIRDIIRSAGSLYRNSKLNKFACEQPGQHEAVDACCEWSDLIHTEPQTGLLLFGPVGSGKDHLAIGSVCKAVATSNGMSARFINGQDLFGRFRDAMDSERDSERAIISEFCGADVLILSDPLPPAGDLTPYQSSMLYRIVNERYSRGRATVATVNVADGVEATNRMGAATWDRLKANAYVIHCNWPSYRKPLKTINC